MLHDRSPLCRDLHWNNVLADSGTQALSAQLAAETRQFRDPAHSQSYHINLDRWINIMANNGAGKPDWAPEFKPIPGLSPRELQIAKAYYIQQMAAMETRTQHMEDFFSPRSELSAHSSLPVRSYTIPLTAIRHYDSTDTRGRSHLKKEIPEDLITYFRTHYPSLDIDKMQRHATEIYREHHSGSYAGYQFHENIKDDLPDRKSIDAFYTILSDESLPIQDRYN